MSEQIEKRTVHLSKIDVVKCFIRWHMAHVVNYNYERMQASGVVWALTPALKKLYGNDKELMKEALERHLQFFNTEPSFGGPIISTTIAMEEQKANGVDIDGGIIDGFKSGLMGPLAGIGDTLWQGTLIPILLSITIPFAHQGNIVMGPVAFWFLHEIIMLGTAYMLWTTGYKKGKEGIKKLLQSSLLNNVMVFCKTLGPIVMGALTAGFVTIKTPIKIGLGEGAFLSIQTGVLDKLMLGLLPFSVTLGTYFALKKKVRTGTVLLTMILVGAVLAALDVVSFK